MKHKLLAIALVASAALANTTRSDACTGITLKSADGSTVTARTIEWAVSDNHNRYVLVPRSHTWHSLIPGGGQGRAFTGKYGYVGFAVEQPEFIVEGLNEEGLSVGLFYFPGYGKYEDYCPENKESSVADLQLVSYILGCCATVDEVIDEIGRIHVHNIDPRASTAHWRFTEPGGRQVVLEIIDGKCVFYENTLGVLTNSPSFDWHLTNLNNYVNLTSGAVQQNTVGTMNLKALGGGTALLGIPGDFTPPSRFIRAAFFQATAPVLETPEKTAVQAFHILNNFDIPIGIQTAQGATVPDLPSATQFTTATDLSGRKIYIRTMYNSHIRVVDLNKINFKKAKFRSELLDPDKREPIENLL